MKELKIIKTIRQNEKSLRTEHSVKSLFIFGSFARGEENQKSDIDILVEFSSADIGFIEFLKLKHFLEEILKKRVDLVTRDALKEGMRAEIERDAIRAA